MSVPLQSVPEDNQTDGEAEDIAVTHAKHEAAEIVARARRQAEAIVAEARSSVPHASPLAALGDNAEEIIKQVRKLIAKQRELQTDRDAMEQEIVALKSERDELVQRLTDAVVRMEELAAIADLAKADGHQPATQPPPLEAPPPFSPPPSFSPPPTENPLQRAEREEREEQASPAAEFEHAERKEHQEDTSLAARLERAEREEHQEDTSLAARLERAEREDHQEDSSLAAKLERAEREEQDKLHPASGTNEDPFDEDADSPYVVGADGRSFYSRHTAKLPRLEGDGGRSALSMVGAMRPDLEPKGRKKRRKKDK